MNKLSVFSMINLAPNKLGAMEEYALELSRALVSAGHRSVVGFATNPPDWLASQFAEAGAEVVALPQDEGSLSWLRHARRLIRTMGCNIVHATFYPCFSLALAAAGTGAKFIYSDQVSRVVFPPGGWRATLRFVKNKAIQPLIAHIIADAEFVRDIQVRYAFTSPAKISVIYNGVRTDRFKKVGTEEREELRERLGLPRGGPIVVSVAQCAWYKGLDYLLDAAALVIRAQPSTVFVIVGDGPQKKELQGKAHRLNIGNNVIFTGLRIDTEAFLAAADVFVLLSVWHEAFAFSLLEAAASGCPIVATRIGAIPESVQDGVTGLLVPPCDGHSAAEAITRLLEDEDLRSRMGRAGRKRVENHFTLKQWVDNTMTLYEQLIRGKQ